MGVLTKNGGSRSEGWLLSTILIVAISLTLAPVLRLFVEGVTDQGAVGLSLAGEVLRQPVQRGGAAAMGGGAHIRERGAVA